MKRKWKQLPPGELEGPFGFSIPRPLLTSGHEPIRTSIEDKERDRIQQDLLEYCERDTWATVNLLQRLRKLAAE